MKDNKNKQSMILCCGMQSSGTTLLSWCFLQRKDMDGVYDMENSVIHTDFSRITTPHTWVKMTIGSFRWLDVKEVYNDMGWQVKPLMLVRDTRHVLGSLIGKNYGINGVVAEEPPIRMRFRRFLQDWHYFRDREYPIVKYEDFVATPESVLRDLMPKFQLEWDESMIEWRKSERDISYMSRGNQSFLDSRRNVRTLQEALSQGPEKQELILPEQELSWLDRTFREFNEYHGYPSGPGITDNLTVSDTELPYSESTRVEQNRKLESTNRKAREMYEQYRDCRKKLDRIKYHVVLGRLLKFWNRYINSRIEL